MMCECYQVGGRFIAEDPDCPVHGYAAQREAEQRSADLDILQEQIEQAETVEELRVIMLEMLTQMR
jgi:hypothetical protein